MGGLFAHSAMHFDEADINQMSNEFHTCEEPSVHSILYLVKIIHLLEGAQICY